MHISKDNYGVIAFIEAHIYLVEHICHHQFDDEILCLIRDKVLRGEANKAALDSDGLLMIECRIYFPTMGKLTRFIPEESLFLIFYPSGPDKDKPRSQPKLLVVGHVEGCLQLFFLGNLSTSQV